MANIRKSIAAATAVVNYDLISDEINALLPEARVLKGVGLVGSTAAGDTVVEVMVGNRSIGKYENSATGTALDVQRDVKVTDEFIPSNQRVQVIVRDAPETNPIIIYLEFGKPQRTITRRRRTFSRSRTTNRGRRTTARAGGFF